jgi:hypothetical protein
VDRASGFADLLAHFVEDPIVALKLAQASALGLLCAGGLACACVLCRCAAGARARLGRRPGRRRRGAALRCRFLRLAQAVEAGGGGGAVLA